MKRLILTLLSTAAAVTLAAQPDSLDYRGDYYFSKRSQQESLPVRPHHTVMLGNSLTERGAWAEYFPEAHVINRGIGGDCVAGMAARLDSIVAGRPRAIFLMAGVNDLIFSTIAPEALLRQYERLLDRIAAESPATQVFIQSPLPLDEARNEPYFTGKNARIEAFDRLLRRMAARRGLKFIDIRSRMLRDGKLPAEYTVDGIHLTPAGYAVWVEALRPYVTPAGARIGTVTCAGRGLAGVVVSAATDSAGRFVLPANDRAHFVFVSTPAGYASPSEERVVRHYLPAKSDGSSHDFRLRRKPSGETRHGFVVVADPQLFARKEFRLLERAAKPLPPPSAPDARCTASARATSPRATTRSTPPTTRLCRRRESSSATRWATTT